jgi:hypothetical protein
MADVRATEGIVEVIAGRGENLEWLEDLRHAAHNAASTPPPARPITARGAALKITRH